MKAKERASKAQAFRLASIWSGMRCPVADDGKYTDPTILACIKRKWLAPTDDRGRFPSGAFFTNHAITDEGLFALEAFLRDERLSR